MACDDNGIASFDLVRHQRDNESIFLYAFDLIELNGDGLWRATARPSSPTPVSLAWKDCFEAEGFKFTARAARLIGSR